MDNILAPITLVNMSDLAIKKRNKDNQIEIRKIEREAVVNSGSVMLIINEEVKKMLGLTVSYVQTIQRLNGSIEKIEVVGPIKTEFRNRSAVGNAWVLKDVENIYLGTTQMLEMDVVIVDNQLTFNPLHDNKWIIRI
jgi:hypothetical protein